MYVYLYTNRLFYKGQSSKMIQSKACIMSVDFCRRGNPNSFSPFLLTFETCAFLSLYLLSRGPSSAVTKCYSLNAPRIIEGIDSAETMEFGKRLFHRLAS